MLENKSLLNNLLDDSALEDVAGGQGNHGAGQKMHACPGGTFGKIVETEKFSSGGYRVFKCVAWERKAKSSPCPDRSFSRLFLSDKSNKNKKRVPPHTNKKYVGEFL